MSKSALKINPELKKQEFEGWGTAICWWGNIIGNWQDKDKQNDLLDLIFSHKNGLGINVVRYNIGGGQKPSNVKNFRVGADIPCYMPAEGIWEWGNDAGQRSVLLQAINRGVNIIEAFANTPPEWMTISGSTAGNVDGLCNLQKDRFNDFATYLVQIIKNLSNIYNVKFNTLSPFNEPSSFWWKSENNQEGCHYNIEEQIKLVEILGDILVNEGLQNEIDLSGPEGWSTYESIFAYNSYSQKAKKYISQINTHSYFSDDKSRVEIYDLAKRDNKKLWMSEFTCGGTVEHSHNDITSALELAENIIKHLNEMGATAWIYWQAVEDEKWKHNHGLIHANFVGEEEYWLTKQYYAFANFSKFIKNKAVVLKVSIENVLTVIDNNKREIIIVALNDKDVQDDIYIDLSMFKDIESQVNVFRTSIAENLSQLQDINILGKAFKTTLEKKSITTFVLKLAGSEINA